ncbi:MAG: peptide ABC transporter substrate-binding protein [Ktedonobacteraceae bacterium]
MFKRPKSRRLSLAFSLLVLLMMFISACAPQGGTPPPTTNSNPVKGGTWIDDLYEPVKSLIPNGVSETFADLIDETIYTPLLVGDTNGKLQPALATEVPTVENGDVSADLKTWTYKIRPGVKWTDGQPVDARDVDFTWKLWKNPKFGAASTTGYELIKSADVSTDNMKITFHLSAPFVAFNTAWTDGLTAPLPAHHFSSMSPDAILKSPDNLNPSVTDGPFMMKESKAGDHFTVVRNPNYYRASEGLPYLDQIVFRLIPDQNTILKDFQAGTITSSWFLDVTKTPAYKALSNYHIVVNPNASNFEAMYFNLDNPLLKDVNVRKAMAMAIDHNALINTARRGQAVPLCTDHGKAYVPGYQADAPCPKYDPAAANALLDSAGYVKGSDGIRTKGGKRLEFKYSTTANNPWRAADEDILQQNFQAIGIKLNIQNYSADTYFGTVLPTGKPGTFDIGEYENSWTYDADDASAFSCSQVPSSANSFSGGNYSKYCNPALDKLFTQEQSTGDPNQRQQYFNQIHQIYLTDFPFVTLYGPTDMAVVKNNTHNYLPGPEGASETINVWSWWCDGGKC